MLSFLQPIWPFYSFLRVIVIFLDIVLFFLFLFALTELWKFRPHFVTNPQLPPRKKKHKAGHAHQPTVIEAWAKVKTRLAEGTPAAARLAVIEADALVDNYLKRRNYAGDTFADRLSRVNASMVPAVDRAWGAHRLRNDLVHTPGFEVHADRAGKALDDYEAFLREMGAFDVAAEPKKKHGDHDEHGGPGEGAAHAEHPTHEKLVFSSSDE